MSALRCFNRSLLEPACSEHRGSRSGASGWPESSTADDPSRRVRLARIFQSGKPFGTLVVEFCIGMLAEPVVQEQRKYFNERERLAALFTGNVQLQVFGTDDGVLFSASTPAMLRPRLTWQRIAEWQGRVSGNETSTDWSIATVGIEGRFTYFSQ